MGDYGYVNPFNVCFTSMKLRYVDYDSSIDKLNFVKMNDKINVFINLESILSNLSILKDLDNKLLLERNFPIILESEIINLAAHYKRFFRKNNLTTRVFIYYTDLESEEFLNYKYNDEFRSFYTNKYLNNPRFQLLGKTLIEKIIPRVSKIMEFIPYVYFINAKNIDSSLVPYIISKEDPSYKNFIITNDRYETQYQLINNFAVHHIRKSMRGTAINYSFDKTISDMVKTEDGEDLLKLFRNPSFYSTLLGILGDKPRFIEQVKGLGVKTIGNKLDDGIKNGIIAFDTLSIQMISMCFDEENRKDIINNFKCTDILSQYNDLSEKNISEILVQIIDRFDYNSLLELNRTVYNDYQLKLEELTC